MQWGVVALFWALTPQKAILEPLRSPSAAHTCTHLTLAILGNIGGMYSESPDLHAASPLHQCFSLEDLDRYL